MTSINSTVDQVAGAVANAITSDALVAKLPATLQPIARQYAPVVVQWGADYVQQWLALMFAGNQRAAYQLYLKQLPAAADIFAEAEKFSQQLEADVTANADKIAEQKDIASTVCNALLPVVLALVGL